MRFLTIIFARTVVAVVFAVVRAVVMRAVVMRAVVMRTAVVRVAVVVAGVVLAAGNPWQAGLPSAGAAPVRVVASFPIPADWAREIGGTGVSAVSLAPPGADPHSWQPAPADVRKLREADLIIAVSPEMEGWFARLAATTDLRAKTVWLGIGVETAKEADANARDPHLWLDPELVVKMTARLADALAIADAANANAYAAAQKKYAGALRELDAAGRDALGTVPPRRRELLSQHDNLRRIAGRHGLRAGAALLAGATTEAPDPPPRKLAAFIRAARKAGTPLFYDGDAPGPLIDAVTRDAGLPPPVRLFTDTLAPAPHAASTYLGMYRENIRRIAEALGAEKKMEEGNGAKKPATTPSPAAAVQKGTSAAAPVRVGASPCASVSVRVRPWLSVLSVPTAASATTTPATANTTAA